ncbi:MAG: hypothetical protein JWO13_830 [Acidobacteriales bacterium]|nr:hypothetical protein [Terriglobales bacterium]
MTATQILYVAFVLGSLLFSIVLANKVLGQKRFPSLGAYVRFYGIALLCRFAFELIGYSVLLSYPQAVPSVLAWIGISFPTDFFLDPRIAFIVGFIADVVLGKLLSLAPDKWKWLTKWIPESPAGEPDENAQAAAAGSGK